MTRIHRSSSKISAAIVAGALIALISSFANVPVIAPVSAQSSECDCSCEGYTKLMQIVESFKAQQESGETQQIPPEMMQMGMCGGQCAMNWAQCQNPDLDMSEIERARGAAQQERDEYSGADAISRERAINERSIGETEKNLQPDTTRLPKDSLTADYLEGMWCSVYGGQETSQWRFTGSGRYEIGLPGGSGYVMQSSGDSIGEFHDRFEKVVDLQADTFTTEHRHGRKNVFTRGACN